MFEGKSTGIAFYNSLFDLPFDTGKGEPGAGGGNAIGVDYSKASGADAVIVVVGPGGADQRLGAAKSSKAKMRSVTAGGK